MGRLTEGDMSLSKVQRVSGFFVHWFKKSYACCSCLGVASPGSEVFLCGSSVWCCVTFGPQCAAGPLWFCLLVGSTCRNSEVKVGSFPFFFTGTLQCFHLNKTKLKPANNNSNLCSQVSEGAQLLFCVSQFWFSFVFNRARLEEGRVWWVASCF